MKKKACHSDPNPPSHRKHLSRLNRISGQVEGVKKMVEEQRYCPDILIQMRAIRSALLALEGQLLEAHLDHCVRDAFTSGDEKHAKEKIAELRELFNRFGG